MTYQPCANRRVHKIVDLSIINHNLQLLEQLLPDTIVMPVVKANAYGHGMVEVSKHLEKQKRRFFGVAFADEALQLRKQGITSDILVMGVSQPESIAELIEQRIVFAVSNLDTIFLAERICAQLGCIANVHVKFNTGMNRLGMSSSDLPVLYEALEKSPRVKLTGVFSHFACADEPTHQSNQLQLTKFNEILTRLEKNGIDAGIKHICNSAGAINFPGAKFDMVRIGIAMYGCSPSEDTTLLAGMKPSLNLLGKVAHVIKVKPGDSVSYGGTWVAEKSGIVANVPIGYGDGYMRNLSNGKGKIICKGKEFPIIGRVCMDQLMFFSESPDIVIGDVCHLLGQHEGHSITAEELAMNAGTIPYEILTSLNDRLETKYHTDN